MSATKVIRTGAERVELVYATSPELGGKPIGYVSKLRDTRTDKHPWKSFHYVACVNGIYSAAFRGSYYPQEGVKAAAILAAK